MGTSSTSAGSEALGVNGGRLVAELHEQPGRLLDEGGRPADIDARHPRGLGSDGGQHLAVDPPRPAPPVGRRRTAGQREMYRHPATVETGELLSVENVVERSRGKQQLGVRVATRRL